MGRPGSRRYLKTHRASPYWTDVFAAFLIIIGLVTYALSHHELASLSSKDHSRRGVLCKRPSVRREWRQLTYTERRAYVDAVVCLTQIESRVRPGGSLYDDLAWTHMFEGTKAHEIAPFLPWHRAFLDMFEHQLQSECGFQGSIPYWDWSLDWNDLANAPVFDDVAGFGGDGDGVTASPFIDDSSTCVTTGPFQNVTLRYIKYEAQCPWRAFPASCNKAIGMVPLLTSSCELSSGTVGPHCLARGFFHAEKNLPGEISGEHLSPDVLQRLSSQLHYDRFRNLTEQMLHNALHWGIRGDFGQLSAANDPLFYLHHAQLDRLWSEWQQMRDERQQEYYGYTTQDSFVAATLDDRLQFLELGPSLRVEEVMHSRAGRLCYIYS